MIVIDVGCAAYGGDSSIPYLIEEFGPSLLIGLDPAARTEFYEIGETQVSVIRVAAWVFNGEIGFTEAGLRGHVDPGGPLMRCLDLSSFIMGAFDDPEIVLKMDAEGAEYVLLPHLRDTVADEHLKLAWVEWHCPSCGTGWFTADDLCPACGHHEPGKRSDLEASMRCEMHQWNR